MFLYFILLLRQDFKKIFSLVFCTCKIIQKSCLTLDNNSTINIKTLNILELYNKFHNMNYHTEYLYEYYYK